MIERFYILLLFLSLFPVLPAKRGGGFGLGRGSSGARTRVGGGGGSKGGLFGSRTSSGGSPSGGFGSRTQNTGTGGWGQKSGGHTWNGRAQTSSNNRGSGGFFGSGRSSRPSDGGIFGRSSRIRTRHSPHCDSRGFFGKLFGTKSQPGAPCFTKSGMGSHSRSNTFKNMVVGAAAGYLTYQAGKHIIRSMSAPMMWNNRPYYWGQSYYQPRHTQSQMCRMPIDPNDPQFGSVYQPGGMNRPKEIVWGCGAYEYCCGMECCAGGGAGSHYGNGMSAGGLFILFLLSLCGMGLLYNYCRRRQL